MHNANYCTTISLTKLMPRVPGIKLGKRARRNPLEHLLWKDPEELPADVEGLEYRPVMVGQNIFQNCTNLGHLLQTN